MSRNVLRDHKTLTEEIDGAFFAASGVKRILVSFLTMRRLRDERQELLFGKYWRNRPIEVVLPDSHFPGYEMVYTTVLEDMGFAQHLTHGLPCELVVRP